MRRCVTVYIEANLLLVELWRVQERDDRLADSIRDMLDNLHLELEDDEKTEAEKMIQQKIVELRIPTSIWVNGDEHRWSDGPEISYETAVAIAGKTGQPTVMVFTVQDHTTRSLLPGQTCPVRTGMRITCMDTNQA